MDAALAGLPGIYELRVDVRRTTVHVKFDPEQITPARLAKTLDARGDYACAAPDSGEVERVGP